MPGFPVPLEFAQSKLMSIMLVMPSNYLILCCPLLLLLSIFPSIRVFSNDQLFASGDQSIAASSSASVLPMNIHNWFPLGLTCIISLQSSGLSRVFSSTTVWKYQFFDAQPSLYCPALTSNMTTGKVIALTRQTFVSKVMSLLFNMLSRFVIVFFHGTYQCLLNIYIGFPS